MEPVSQLSPVTKAFLAGSLRWKIENCQTVRLMEYCEIWLARVAEVFLHHYHPSGTCSTLLFQPLDLVKTRQQVSFPPIDSIYVLVGLVFWQQGVKYLKYHQQNHPIFPHILPFIQILPPTTFIPGWMQTRIDARDREVDRLRRKCHRTLERAVAIGLQVASLSSSMLPWS